MVSSLKWMEKDKIDMKVRMLSIAMVLFLSGCAVTVRPKAVATSQEVLQNKRAQLMTKGNSIDFADGYIDGCSSGKRAIGEKRYQAIKDPVRYKLHSGYSRGWERGYYECRDESINKLQQRVKQEDIPTNDAAEAMERAKIWNEIRK